MENATAALHGVSIVDTVYGVQNVAGTARLDSNTQLRNTNSANPGVGVSVIGSASYPTRRASAIVHDTTITGFGNGIDIQPTAAQGLPAGTAEIVGVTFNAPFYSALSAVDAVDVRFVSSRVLGAKTDGIFLVNSTAVIERSEIRDSLNTGVTFWGCPNGATIRGSVVAGSAHQGVAVVADSANGRVSRNVAILDNTLTNNAIADVLVAGESEALVFGNTMTSASTTSVRLHDGSAATLDRQPAPGSRGGCRGQGWLRARQHLVGIQRPRHLRRARLRKRGSALFALRVPGQRRFVRRLLGVREQRSTGRRPVLHAWSRWCPCAVQQCGDGRGRDSQLLGKRFRTAASARRRLGIDSGVEHVERIERGLPAVPHLHAGELARQRIVRSFRRRYDRHGSPTSM